MHRFEVWSPTASSVELHLPGGPHGPARDLPCERHPGDWWRVTVEQAGPGTAYAYRIDGGPPVPDPRSARQPGGVHTASEVFDTGAHRWGDGDWAGSEVLGGVFYELHVGTFTPEGTFDAAIGRLDHLVSLGVDVVSLMPVAAFDGHHGWGYDGVAMYAVHEPYGGPAGLQRLVDACHARGLAVCLDVVPNHLGPSGNYLGLFGPYTHAAQRTPWGEAMNLDGPGSHEVRAWIVEGALRWLRDFHLDALRLDAVHALLDTSAEHVLAQLSTRVAELSHEVGRPLTLIAESDLNDPMMIEPVAEGGRGMHGQWSDDFHHAVRALLSGDTSGYYCDFGSVDVLEGTLTRVFRHDGGHSLFRGKPWGAPVDPTRHRGHSFLAYQQNHDQIGNRAIGDRSHHGLSAGRAAVAAALVLTSPFTPMLFMGEEWAAATPWQFFTDFDDDLGARVRQGRTAEFAEHGWRAEHVPDPQDPSTVTNSRLRWDELDRPPHDEMLAWYRALISLRRSEKALRDDDLAAVSVTKGPGSDAIGTGWFVVHRNGIDVLVNLLPGPARLPAEEGSQVLLASPGSGLTAGDLPRNGIGDPTPGYELPADCVVIVRRP